jgi:hypothetical protein
MKSVINLLFILFLMACDSNQGHFGTEAMLIDLTGLDGCGWVFELDSGEKLEPSNLHEFEIELIDSAQYAITYESSLNGSLCMVGDIILLQSIQQISN